MFFAKFDYIYPLYDIHGWKATDLSFDLAPSDKNFMHPTSRQNFGDGPGQTPKLILTLCLKSNTQKGKYLVLFCGILCGLLGNSFYMTTL